MDAAPGGTVRLGPDTALAAAPGTEDTALWLRTTLGDAFGLPLPPGSADATDTLALALDAALPAEGYRLEADARWGVRITGGGPAGVFWGAQTLRQLLGPHAFRRAPLTPGQPAVLPQLTVEDGPASAGAACCSTSPGTSCPRTACCATSTCSPRTNSTSCTCT
ncbi:glycoside hydrolase family 20 zincin-like fold domain-containing protein [Streptomyces endophytica]|uniref:Glycoside hydrolase family 20 zincin-like fold domain-containing protein n=1 Tax=Streptomyces endophytica TaxID=2991496 RepID=A0ABY6PKE6_9ACTN|nr:glycoside hydrolase family 20 zincin-like fold domain-containing protein [Streptomyces endophytica]UZJ34007.1 glycoside hydrolase family 20 zincin-like fold domain-containing protein [Streptomyces endophytica]